MESQITLEFFKNIGIVVALTVGLTQITKGLFTGKMERFTPLLPLVFGVALSMLIFAPTVLGLLVGIMAGLSAAGLYDQHKIVIQ